LVLRLDDFDTSTIQQGMCLSIYGFVYIIGTFAVPHIPERIEKRFTLILAAFFMGIFLFLVGPSALLGFNESLTLLIAGLVLTACFLGPLAIPVLPEVLAAVDGQVQAKDKIEMSNYAGALFNTSLGLG